MRVVSGARASHRRTGIDNLMHWHGIAGVLPQPSTERTQYPKMGADVDVQHGIPLFVRHVVNRAMPDVARVVHDDI